ncbi:MAG: bifunctional hydroxymethylpyrimidine kinase/phosphomethylpyrimidine kinase [Pseudomonadota bacterium]
MKTYHRVLCIAGSDSSGGAGIQADLKTVSSLGCYGMTVITALTSQNTQGVTAIHAVPPDFIVAQLTAVIEDIGVDAVKIGMLFSAENIHAVSSVLHKYDLHNIILDPVMASQSGRRLLQDDAIPILKSSLFQQVDLLMPNLPEAEILLGRKIHGPEGIQKAAIELSAMGCKDILIKGGHTDGMDTTDRLYLGRQDRFVSFRGSRVNTVNDHGTGCTLSSAIASFLAKGMLLEDAVQSAKQYINGALQAGAEYTIGKGKGPVHHFYQYW